MVCIQPTDKQKSYQFTCSHLGIDMLHPSTPHVFLRLLHVYDPLQVLHIYIPNTLIAHNTMVTYATILFLLVYNILTTQLFSILNIYFKCHEKDFFQNFFVFRLCDSQACYYR